MQAEMQREKVPGVALGIVRPIGPNIEASGPPGYGVFRTKSAEEARRLYASYPCVSENRVFADVGGHVAWQMIGDLPVRKGSNGLIPTPGWQSSAGWAPRTIDWVRSPMHRRRTAQAPGFLEIPGWRISTIVLQRRKWTNLPSALPTESQQMTTSEGMDQLDTAASNWLQNFPES